MSEELPDQVKQSIDRARKQESIPLIPALKRRLEEGGNDEE